MDGVRGIHVFAVGVRDIHITTAVFPILVQILSLVRMFHIMLASGVEIQIFGMFRMLLLMQGS